MNLDLTAVYSKTAKGVMAASSRGKRLSFGLMRVLSIVNGKSTVEELLAKHPNLSESGLAQDLDKLVSDGYIKLLRSGPSTILTLGDRGPSTILVAETSVEDFLAAQDAMQARAKEESFSEREAELLAKEEIAAKARQKAIEEAEAKAREKERMHRKVEEAARQEAGKKAKAAAAEQARKQEAERKARELAEAIARAENEERARAEEKTRLEAEKRARREAEEKARREAEEMARAAAAEEKSRKEAERKALAEAQTKAKAEAAEQKRREAEEKARIKADEKARKEAEWKAREEAEARARAEAAEQKRREDEAEARAKAEEKARKEAERKARAEAEAMAKAEAAERKRREAAEKALVKAEEQARKEAEWKAREEAETRARAEAAEQKRREDEQKARAKAEKKARKEAERQAREEAKRHALAEVESRTKKEAEERSLREAARQAKLDAEARAKADAEAQARRQADEEARERAEIEARARALAEAMTEEPLSPPPSARIKKTRQRAKWGRIGLLAAALLVVVPLLLLHIVSLNVFLPAVEKMVSEQIQEPVMAASLHASVWPAPHLRLEGVAIGKIQDVKIAVVRITPALAMLFEETRLLKSIELESAVIDQDALRRLPDWVLTRDPDKFRLQRIVLKDSKIDIRDVPLPALDAEITLTERGRLNQAVVWDAGKNNEIRIVPKGAEFDISLTTKKWQAPFGPKLLFDTLSAKGTATTDGMRLQFDGQLYGGTLKGTTAVEWGDFWRATGNFQLSRIELGEAAPTFTADIALSGWLDAMGTYAMEARNLSRIFDLPRIKASFASRDGVIGNINLAGAAMAREPGQIKGGRTKYDTLSGNLTLDGNRYQFRQMKLESGSLKAMGEAEITPDKELTGRISTQLDLKSGTTRSRLRLSGNLKQPAMR